MRRSLSLLMLLLPFFGFANHFVGGQLYCYATADDNLQKQFRVRLLLISDCDADDANIIYENPLSKLSFANLDYPVYDSTITSDSSDWTLIESGQFRSASYGYCNGVATTCDTSASANLGFQSALWEGIVRYTSSGAGRMQVTYQACCYYNGLAQIMLPAQTDFMMQVAYEPGVDAVDRYTPRINLRACLGQTMAMNLDLKPYFQFVEPVSIREEEASPALNYDYKHPLSAAQIDTILIFGPSMPNWGILQITPSSPELGLVAIETGDSTSFFGFVPRCYTEHVIFAQPCSDVQAADFAASPFINAQSDTTNLALYSGGDSLIFSGLGENDEVVSRMDFKESNYGQTLAQGDSIYRILNQDLINSDLYYPIIFEVIPEDTGGCTYRNQAFFVRWFQDYDPSGRGELSSNTIRLFPNPTDDGLLQIDTEEAAILKAIDVYTPDGRKLQQRRFDAPRKAAQLNLPDTPGIYFLDIQTTQGRVVKRVVRQ